MSGTNQEIEGSTTVQSVTGPNVDNTDPANPVVNPLGLIKIVDLNGEFFTDLATASAYVATFTITTVTEESYFPVSGTLGGVYYFTVPKGSAFNLADNFLSDSAFIITASAYMEDRLGLITSFNNYAFYNSSGDNKIGNNCIFKDSAFAFSSGNNTIGDNCSFNDYAFDKSSGIYTLSNFTLLSLTNVFAANTTGKFILNGTIGASTAAEYSNFFTSSTATIFARKEAYTNNAGGIEGDLQTAISNGCNVQFDGIDLATIPNLALKSPIASPTFTGTVTTPAIIVSSETASTIASFDGSKNIKSLSTGTYPDLTELSRVKGLSSPIQTQLDAKLAKASNLSDLANSLTARINLGIIDMHITTGDQTTTSSGASNITDLVSPTLAINSRYKINGLIRVGCNATGGVKLQITIPTGATMSVIADGNTGGNGGRAFNNITTSATLFTTPVGTVNSVNSYALISGEISIGATAGTIQFGFASTTNTQLSSIYQLGTNLTLIKIT